MGSPRTRPDATTVVAAGLLAVIGANLLPLVGVLAWGWDLTSLLIVYWVEALATVLLAALKALFAERGSPSVPGGIEPLHELRAKRGGWQPRDGWPPIYPRNVPFALSILGFWVVTVCPLTVLYLSWVSPTAALSPSLGLGIVALLVAQASSFVSEYVGDERYRDVSAREVLRTPGLLGLVIVTLGWLGTAGRAGGLVVLAGAVIVKTGVSASRFYADRVGRSILHLGERFGADADLSEPPPEPDVPDADVIARVAADRRSVLLGSVGAIGFGFVHRLGLGALAAFGFALLVRDLPFIAVTGLAVLAIVAARVLSYYLRYGTVEYRRRGDALVAYDRLLDAPQWIVSVEPTMDVSVRNAIADRLLGTGTLVVSGVDSVDRDEVRLGPVRDVDRAVERLDLPVARTDRPDRDPAAIAACAGLSLLFLAVPAGLFLTPRVETSTAVGVSVAFGPFFLLLVGVLVWAALSRI